MIHKKLKRKFIIVDLDHTIRDAAWRDEMIGGEGGWDAYHMECINDKPATDIIELVNALHKSGFIIIGCTACNEKWRQLNLKYLMQYGVRMDELLMRPEDDFSSAGESKEKLLKERFGDNLCESILAVIDDNDNVRDMCKSHGLTVLQVHGRNY